MKKKFLFEYDRDELKELFKECIQEFRPSFQDQPQIDLANDRMSQKQTAKYLNISEVTLIDWKKKGFIPFHQIPNTRRIYFLKSELKKVSWQNNRLIKAN